jgi:hypothetical protein
VNIRVIIIAVVLIAAIPIIYLFAVGYEPEEVRNFRGSPIREIAAAEGALFVPNESENKAGVPMKASLSLGLIEKVTGKRTANLKGFDLVVDSVDDKVIACGEDGTTPVKASFELASKCAPADYDNMKLDRRTALLVDPEAQFIVYGNGGSNPVRLHTGNVIINYTSQDMTQSERKDEACMVRMMVDYLLGKTPSRETSCL